MNWDPKTAIVLYKPYQPIDIHAIACKEVLKSIHQTKTALDRIITELALYDQQSVPPEQVFIWRGRKVGVLKTAPPSFGNGRDIAVTINRILKLEGIESSFLKIKEDFSQSIKCFETTFMLEITPIQQQIGTLSWHLYNLFLQLGRV